MLATSNRRCSECCCIVALKELSRDEELAFDIPKLSEAAALAAARTACMFPGIPPHECLKRVFPWEHVVFNPDAIETLDKVLGALRSSQSPQRTYELKELRLSGDSAGKVPTSQHRMLVPVWEPSSEVIGLEVASGTAKRRSLSSFSQQPLALTADQHILLHKMLQSHAVGRDILLLGPRGCGKSYITRAFASALGYVPAEVIPPDHV